MVILSGVKKKHNVNVKVISCSVSCVPLLLCSIFILLYLFFPRFSLLFFACLGNASYRVACSEENKKDFPHRHKTIESGH